MLSLAACHTALLFMLAANSVAADVLAPASHTPVGTFIGNNSIAGVDQFLGIRYAMPPIGDLRFENPQRPPAQPNHTFLATDYGPGCLQDPSYALYNGLSEDCLTLNVIRPYNMSTPSDELLPVLFFIHVGGNQDGQSIFYNGTVVVQSASLSSTSLATTGSAGSGSSTVLLVTPGATPS
jgi:carboxylesterase type B